MAKEPNHTCKNPSCGKSFWACDDCDKNRGLHWRSLCCSVECFKEYMTVIDERDSQKVIIEENIQEEIKEENETPIKKYKK